MLPDTIVRLSGGGSKTVGGGKGGVKEASGMGGGKGRGGEIHWVAGSVSTRRGSPRGGDRMVSTPEGEGVGAEFRVGRGRVR